MKSKMSRSSILSISILILCLLCFASSAPGTLMPLNGEKSAVLSSGWSYTSKSNPAPTPVILPSTKLHNATGGTVILTRNLPTNFVMGATLLIRTTRQSVRVLVNDEVVYSFGNSSNRTLGNTIGDAYHLVRLPHDYVGQKLTVELFSAYHSNTTVANTIYYGTKSAHIFTIISSRLVNTVTGFLLFAFGFAVLVFYFITYKMSSRTQGLFYLAGFALLSGIWIMLESGLVQFFVNSPLLIYTGSCLALLTFPLLLLEFIGSDYVFKKSRLIILAVLVHRIFILVVLILQLFWEVDFHKLIPLYYVLLAAETGLVFYLCYKYKARGVAKVIMVAMGGLVLTVLLNILFLIQNRATDVASVIHYGIIFFTAVVAISAGRHIITMNKTTALNSALEQLAYADPMTGLKNRAAFQERLDSYEHEPELLDKVTIAVADLNFLKKINDTFGHKKGDEIIILCAATLASCFSSLGTVYRIGGDEFVVIMDNVTTPQCNEALNAVTAAMKQYNKSDEAQIFSVAVGLVHYNWAYDKSINDLFTRADTAMYNKKESLKKAQNIRWSKSDK